MNNKKGCPAGQPREGVTNLKNDSVTPAKSQRIFCALKEIRDLNVEIMGAARTTLKKAIRIGELLSQVKSELPHGECLPWTQNLPFSLRTAQHWMGLFANRKDPKFANLANLSQAIKLLAEPAIDVESTVEPSDERPPSSPADAWEIIEFTIFLFTKHGRSFTLREVGDTYAKLLAGGTWLTDEELEGA